MKSVVPFDVPALLDALDEPVSIFSLDGRYVYINAAGEKLLGRPASELLGRTYLEAYPDLESHVYHDAFKRVASGAAPMEALAFHYEPTDSWSHQRLYLIDGHVTVFWQDITERKRGEAALIESRANAESASRAKDEFLAMLGHELRNPLAPILTALELMRLRGGSSSADTRERSVIERQVTHLVRMVDDMLDISRITRGTVELTRERLDLGEIVAKAVETASPIYSRQRHRLTVDVPPGLIVDGDAHRLEQVFSNLLTNAAKYTPPQGTISVSAAREGDTQVLRVSDNGVGIGPELLPRVFDLFVQGRQELDRAQGGLGLGLAIVQRLVELHDGHVSAKSDGLGRGATFSVHLPAVSGDARATSRHPPPLAAEQHGKHVLIVDDNEDAADMVSELLQMLGYTTKVAHDAPSALAAVETFTPRVALLDIGLPIVDGYELAQALRGIDRLRGVYLIALTGYGQQSDRDRATAAGFDEHVVKPVDIARLTKLLEDATSN